MDQRAEYLIQILERIGAPLMTSITEVASRTGETTAQNDAKKMAELLAKTVQVSIDMANMTDLTPGSAPDDALRVALAAVAGPLVAAQFRQYEKVPADADLKRMITALQAVLSFAENFSPAPENIQRLKDLEAQGQIVDTGQANIQYLQAFIPVVGAISTFSFGQPEQKLIMDVASRLSRQASALGETVLGKADDDMVRKMTGLALLKSLAQLYAACHAAETHRLAKMAEPDMSGGNGLDAVWQAFDLRVAMLEALATQLVPGGHSGGTGRGVTPPVAPPQKTPSPEESPLSMFAKPKTEAPQTENPTMENPKGKDEGDSGQGGDSSSNPMSFFKK
jgi:hypothetical protein